MYSENTIYIIGDAKTSSNNPITQKFNVFFIGLVIDKSSGLIVDADCSSTIPLTEKFVKSLFLGKSIMDTEKVSREIETRYFGSSQKALVVAFKNASIKFQQITG
ncbi:DUF3870 domain-containing protein [Pseudalkalibacillus salsuginis]|uniref:DUF3870 domain-containing protein n=1 Tax=Pseudalkalibacillus salsuginis TaxID=2910972 RepID=UPI001F1BF2A0|nr:DUF3870 domain-containing protein [Pseudalkalibacillus salsuginis]MCF6409037.1 DUF3870 domain-containing protein [Pseudalkalibacillus salsuginis]